MSRITFVRLFLVLALTFAASALSASPITYAVGTCRPTLASYQTISAALAALPFPNVVEVCPGTYNEQVEITQPVTLKGISNGDSEQTIIAPPVGGLITNATTDRGASVAAQIWVNNASGLVNISDLTVDATGNGVSSGNPATAVVGIFYHNSSGTVNRVETRNQSGNGAGISIYTEGGSASGFPNPLVTIENSSVHDYDLDGIVAERFLTLTVIINGNLVTTTSKVATGGIQVAATNSTVTSNLVVNPGFLGIFAGSTASSISGNTVMNSSNRGIWVFQDGTTLTSNKIVGNPTGIILSSSGAAIQGNTITNSTVGIDFGCNADPHVHSNIIMDAGTALGSVPAELATSNTYVTVGTIRAGGC